MTRPCKAWLVVAALLLTPLVASAGTAGASPLSNAAEPANRRPPRIEGQAQVGQILEANRGRWSREERATFSFQWRVCDLSGTTCSDVPGATDRIYPVRPANIGQRLVVAVTVTTDAGKAAAASAPTPLVGAAPVGTPLPTTRPRVSGKPELGSVLTVDGGAWQREPTRLMFRWRRCTLQGGACEDLGQTAQTYRLSARDVGHTLRALVRAENQAGRSAALSDPTPPVAGTAPSPVTAPANTSPPRISGTTAVGRTLTASSGTWSGTRPMSFAFEWHRCRKDGGECAQVSRESRQTYTIVEADVGHAIEVKVIARNAAGSGSALSARTQTVVGPRAPVNIAPPTISGTARVGSVLTASPGDWRGTQPIGFRYQWLRCAASGNGCAEISEATARSQTLTAADVGRTLRLRVTATNGGGSSTMHSSPSPLVASLGSAPANTAAPVISGSAQQGARLILSAGSWSGTQPITYSYRWMRCDASGSGCTPIGGASGNAYVLTRADAGRRLFGVVTARNDAGSGSAASRATAVVVGAPVNTSLPRVNGSLVEGQLLRASPGIWTGAGPITFGYQWTRCNAKGEFSSCVPVVVTSNPTYAVRAADVGRRIFVQVKAQNRFGASFVNSDQTGVVAAAPVGTVTNRAGRSVVVYGTPVVLTGRAVGAQPGDPVTIIEQPVRGSAVVRARATVVTSAGAWRYVARPTARATYRAQVRGRTSSAVTVRVRPRLQLRRTGPGRVSLQIVAARSFTGRTALLQRWNAKRHRWTTIRRIRLGSSRIGAAPTAVTRTAFRTRTPRGTLVRVVLASRQSGPGYMRGTSNRVRT